MTDPAQPFDLNHWRDRRVFITGATGLVGGWVLRDLLDAGADPVCLVRDHVPRSNALQTGLLNLATIVHGDLTSYALVERTLNEYEISTVIHLAAQTIVTIANSNPLSTFDTNIRGTWQLLEACRRTKTVESIVIASSDKAYGEAEKLPYDESSPLRGSHPYDVSKSAADLIAQSYYSTYRSPVTITRCGNFFGGGDLNWNRIVPGTFRSAFRGDRPVIRSDGTLRRDYIYVEDAALAYMLIAEETAKRPELHGEAFNFSYEQPKTVREIVDVVLDAAGRTDLEPVVLGQAPNEIPHQFLAAAKARELLGWHPAFSLQEGMKRTASWYRQFFLESSTKAHA